MKQIRLYLLIGIIFAVSAAAALCAGDSKKTDIPPAPTPGQVTMLDLGATKCIPCKMMAPILEELKKDYEGRASIIFIDVWENPEEAKRFGIRSIPTQIFYDKEGKEAGRHVGFLDKESIIKAFQDLGVPEETEK